MRICIVLAPRACDSCVLLDGENISQHVRGVEVQAHVNNITEVTLTLLPSGVEIEGEVGNQVRALLEQAK